MSYCRFSSDDFQCDVYCYEDCAGGFTTHVATNRRTPKEPFPPRINPVTDFKAWWAREKIVGEMLKAAERKPIGLPHDGQHFNDPDLQSFLDRLLSLKAEGYNVPDYAIETVRDEIKTGSA